MFISIAILPTRKIQTYSLGSSCGSLGCATGHVQGAALGTLSYLKLASKGGFFPTV